MNEEFITSSVELLAERKKKAKFLTDERILKGNPQASKATAEFMLGVSPENYEKIKEEKEDKSEEKAKAFLKEDRQKYDSLGCGIHNGSYYFGTKLYKEGRGYNAVITSDKKIYFDLQKNNEIENLFGLNYKGNFFEDSLDNIFSKEAIHNWLYGNTDNITIQSVFWEIIDLYKKYIYLDKEEKYYLLACYRIASFYLPIWRARARLFIWADMGTAKSRLTQILHNTGFNSIALGDWTLPYLKTIIESTKGETHIDDFETLNEELQNATIRLVKVGYMKGFKAGKMSEGKNRKPEVNDLFNTTTLNNTLGLDFISNDRCITLRIPKISNKDYDKEPNFEEPIWKELRDKLYILGLKYPNQIKEVYESISSEKITGRLFSIIKPELTIAKLISPEVYERIENFWVEEIEQRDTTDYESNWEFLAYKKIIGRILSTNTTLPNLSTLSTLTTYTTYTDYFKLQDNVVNPIIYELYGDSCDNKQKRSISISIGNLLSRNPIFHKREVKGKKEYKVKPSELISYVKAKGYYKILNDILSPEVDKVASVDSR